MEKGVGGVSIGVEGALLGVLGSTTWYAISGSYERIISHYGRKGVRRWPTGESRMWVSLLLIDHHHPSAGGSDYVVVAPTARVFEIRISRSSLLRYAISRPSSRYLRSQPTPPCPSSSSSSSPPPCSQPASSSASSLSPSSPHPQVSTPPTPIPPSLTHKQR